MDKNVFQYSRPEELVSTLTHSLGVMLGLFFAFSFIKLGLGPSHQDFFYTSLFFSFSAVLLFLASSVYHFTTSETWKIRFKRADHCAIYFFIAASYTHFVCHHFDKKWTTVLLAIVWGLAIMGMLYKVFSKKRRIFFSVSTYVGFGLIFLILKFFVKMDMSGPVFSWLLIGGFFYISGSFIYMLKKVPHHHGVWHVFVLGGAASHYMSILNSVKEGIQ